MNRVNTTKRYWRNGLALALAVGVLLTLVGSAASAPTDVTWQAEIVVTYTPEQTRQPNWNRADETLQRALASRLANRGVQFESKKQTRADRGIEYTLTLQGNGVAQLRAAMFDDLAPVGGLIGGPAVFVASGAVTQGETFTLTLESNPTTGYGWVIGRMDASLRRVGEEYKRVSNLIGAAGKQVVTLQAAQDGTATIEFLYRRSFEKDAAPTRRVSVQAARLAALGDVSNPASPKMQSAPQPSSAVPRAPSVAAPQDLPASFDWRDYGKVPAIRNQGGCGSCWAFATVGPFESNLMIQDNLASPNLSEQYLLSCNTDGWNCNGGWWAFDYHVDKIPPGESQAGAVLEAEFPYVGWQSPCNAPHNHPYRHTSWSLVDGWNIPSVNALKNAIYNYGPVAVTVCSGDYTSAFHNYSGGIFATDETAQCGGGIDHAVVLVGWNDAEGTWILRNSWGTSWGESGYMRIARNVSNIGYAAAYIVYNRTQCYTLTTSASPSGGGSVSVDPAPNCNGTQYASGTPVTLTAYANPGYAFSSWSGSASGSTNPTTVVMDGNKSVTANFVPAVTYHHYLPIILRGDSIADWITILSENFEGAFPGVWNVFDSNGSSYGEYYWGKRGCRPYAGSYSGWGVGAGAQGAALSCGSNYPDWAYAWMIYGPFSLVDATAADMKFKLWLNSESGYDMVCRMAATDGYNFAGTCTSGAVNWEDRTLDLANVYSLGNLLGQPSVWVALLFYSDSIINYPEGGYVDNIVLRKCTSGSCSVGASPLPPARGAGVEIPVKMTLPKR